jgi:hypothetical protein
MPCALEAGTLLSYDASSKCCEQLQWSNKFYVAALCVHIAAFMMLCRTRAAGCGTLHGVISQFLLYVTFVQSLVQHMQFGMSSLSFAFKNILSPGNGCLVVC